MQAFLCARKRWSWVVSAPFIILFHAGKHWMLRNMPCNAAPLVDAKIWEEPATIAINVSCIIVNPPPPLNKIILEENPGGVSIPIVKSWNLMAGMEAKEEDEEEEEKRRRRRRTTKLELRKKVSTIAMPGAGLLLLFWGLQRGYPLWTCFLAFFNKGFIRKSAVW